MIKIDKGSKMNCTTMIVSAVCHFLISFRIKHDHLRYFRLILKMFYSMSSSNFFLTQINIILALKIETFLLVKPSHYQIASYASEINQLNFYQGYLHEENVRVNIKRPRQGNSRRDRYTRPSCIGPRKQNV